MDVNLFDFDLPEDRIAVRPVSPRDSAKMLHVRHAGLVDRQVRDLPDLLTAGDIMVFNDTKVIPSRLYGTRGETHIEVTLHKREAPTLWKAFARPAKKCRVGDTLVFGTLSAQVIDTGRDGERTLSFDVRPDSMMEALAAAGVLPLPPYIAKKRAVDAKDAEDYQTLYAREEGAVAAPTAGLHFTDDLFQRLDEKGIERAMVTLHVGAGTFLPVKADDTDDHVMHSEYGVISTDTADLINKARAQGNKIISVGTTSMRLLESAADDTGIVHTFDGDTDIFITPGYKFKAVDRLMTNFHLPKSTLFMLVSAFSGLETMQRAYVHAVASGYRFYSYGDSSLLDIAPDAHVLGRGL